MSASGCTTHFSRHLKSCLLWKVHQKWQQQISFQPSNEKSESQMISIIVDGKFDMVKMREAVVHCVLMHEHPFMIVEEEGFNMMQKHGMPTWKKISCITNKNDCVQVYEIKKKKLKALLKSINKTSLTTDLWKSSNQKIEYMVLTAHFIDSHWKFQKRVLNFIHIPHPHHGVEIVQSIYKCLKDCGIENKIFTISIGNASSNDAAIRILKDTFSRNKKLLCGG